MKCNSEELLKFVLVPGHIRITSPVTSDFLPDWVRDAARHLEPTYATGEELLLLDIEVTEPGIVGVQGLWADEKTAVIATSDGVILIWKRRGMDAGVTKISKLGINTSNMISPITFGLYAED